MKISKMGIYSNNDIYGIRLFDDDAGKIVYEKTYSTIMDKEKYTLVREFYESLDELLKKHIFVQAYTECSITLGAKSSKTMMWLPSSTDIFMK